MQHIPRKENVKADALSLFAFSENEVCSRSIYYQVFKTSSIDGNMVALIDTRTTWIDEIKMYLEIGHLPPNAEEARKLKVGALKYALIKGILSTRNPLLFYT